MSTATFRQFTIAADYRGDKQAPFSDAKYDNWNRHVVTIRNRDSGTRTTFDFWASLAEPELRSPSDLRGAFECFLSDAIAGEQSFEEFCGDFGYDVDSRKAEKVWKACQRASTKAKRLLGSADLYKIAEALRDAS